MPKPRKLKKEVRGQRVGTKNSDRRWEADGEEWDSRYEYQVYRAYADAGWTIRRCNQSDTFSFTLPIRAGTCLACGATTVGQHRRYTPDFHVTTPASQHPPVSYYVEAKGYLRTSQRSLLRHFHSQNKDSGVRYLLQRNYPVTQSSSITDWFNKMMKGSQWQLWNGSVPTVWHEPKEGKSPKKSTQRVQRVQEPGEGSSV